MSDVFTFILDGLTNLVDILRSTTFTVGGFTFSYWNFCLSLFLISQIIPLLFVLRSDSNPSKGRGNSERNDGGES